MKLPLSSSFWNAGIWTTLAQVNSQACSQRNTADEGMGSINLTTELLVTLFIYYSPKRRGSYMKGHGAQKLGRQQETASLGTKAEVTPDMGSSLM